MQFFEGKVVSNKTPQTVGVEVSYFKKHAKYQKIIKLTTKLLAHNLLDGVKEGDTVKIVKCRPYSKSKHFIVTEILSSSKVEPKVELKNIKKEEVKPVEKATTKVKEVKKVKAPVKVVKKVKKAKK